MIAHACSRYCTIFCAVAVEGGVDVAQVRVDCVVKKEMDISQRGNLKLPVIIYSRSLQDHFRLNCPPSSYQKIKWHRQNNINHSLQTDKKQILL